MLYSIIGWIYEVVLAFIYGWGFVNRGFLFGPYLPVYGFGAIILILSLGKFMNKKITILNINTTPLIVFMLIILITSIIEYITGSALNAIFHRRWWDYSNDYLNINGYICPRTSIRFGFGGMLFLYILKPAFLGTINRLKNRTVKNISVLCTSVVFLDFTLTIIHMLTK
ncbi:MAG: putative ABC transporter permease [Firmicutes bacterium]|nr:putative ABC transporter permease [Bacillota bacterium]